MELASIMVSSTGRSFATPFTTARIYAVCSSLSLPAYSAISPLMDFMISSSSRSFRFSSSNCWNPISKIRCSAISLAFVLLITHMRQDLLYSTQILPIIQYNYFILFSGKTQGGIPYFINRTTKNRHSRNHACFCLCYSASAVSAGVSVSDGAGSAFSSAEADGLNVTPPTCTLISTTRRPVMDSIENLTFSCTSFATSQML